MVSTGHTGTRCRSPGAVSVGLLDVGVTSHDARGVIDQPRRESKLRCPCDPRWPPCPASHKAVGYCLGLRGVGGSSACTISIFFPSMPRRRLLRPRRAARPAKSGCPRRRCRRCMGRPHPIFIVPVNVVGRGACGPCSQALSSSGARPEWKSSS